MSSDWLTEQELDYLRESGMKIYSNVLISRGAKFMTTEVTIGPGTRIDHGSFFTGSIFIDRQCHIATNVVMFGKHGIAIEACSGISPRVTIFTETDDFTKPTLITTQVPDHARTLKSGPVHIGSACGVGVGSTLMPGTSIGDYGALAGHSFLTKRIPAGQLWGGVPAKYMMTRRELTSEPSVNDH